MTQKNHDQKNVESKGSDKEKHDEIGKKIDKLEKDIKNLKNSVKGKK